jgi:hypothetical protein
LDKFDGTAIISATLEEISADRDYLDVGECAVALAAAEVVAAMKEKPSDDLPEEVELWITYREPRWYDRLAEEASAAVSRIIADSELRVLFEESSEFDAWMAIQKDLLQRLADATPAE